MGKNPRVCASSSVNSMLPSLSGGLECIVFKGLELGHFGDCRRVGVSYKLWKRGGTSAAFWVLCVTTGECFFAEHWVRR